MIVIDSHLDLAWNALGWNRDLTRDIQEMRKAEAGMKDVGRGFNTVSLSEMRKGEVAVCLATVLARKSDLGELNLDFRSRELAYAMGQGQIAYYRVWRSRGISRCCETSAISGSKCADGYRKITPPCAWDSSSVWKAPIRLSRLGTWGSGGTDGLRVIGLAHFGRSAYAHGTGITGGLTPQGPDFLKAMQEAGMLDDLTHLSEESFWVESVSGSRAGQP